MDLQEVQHLEGITIVDPRTSRNRRLIVALSAVAIGIVGWFVFGRPADKAASPLAAGVSPPAAVAGPGNIARQAGGTISDDAVKPLPTIRLAVPPPAASAASAAAPATSPAPSPAAGAPPVTQAASAPGLKLDTEFASAKRIVPFAFNRAGVGPLGTKAVKELAPLAKRADKVNVRGRTDGFGNPGANRKVALDRAQTVYNAFVREGVQKQKLRLTYCTTCFVAPNDSEAGRRLNRRVEVELIMPRDEIAKLPKPIFALEAPPPLLAASRSLREVSR